MPNELERKVTVTVTDKDVSKGHDILKKALIDDRRAIRNRSTPQDRTVAKRFILAEARNKAEKKGE